MKPEFKILSPTAILGYGFPEASFLRGMAEKPDLKKDLTACAKSKCHP